MISHIAVGLIFLLVGIVAGGSSMLLTAVRLKRQKKVRELAQAETQSIKRTPTPGCYQCHHSIDMGCGLECNARRDPLSNSRRFCDRIRYSIDTQCDDFEPKALHENSLMREGNQP